MVGHLTVESELTKPTIGKVQMHLVAETTLGRMPMQYPTSSIRIINSGSIEGRPILL